MSLEPTDLLVVNRGGKDYKITVQDIYNYVNQFPWRAHEGGIFHVIITNPATINLTNSSVVHIIDLADGQEVDVIGHAGEFIVLTEPNAKEAFGNSSGNWTFGNLTDTSQVTSMEGIFVECRMFNSDLSMFDTSNVLNMFNVFNGATAFNQDISNWDVSNVTGMTQMFRNARAFNQDIGSWNVSNLRIAEAMFNGARAFNQDLSKWCVSKVRNEPSEFATGAVAWTKPKPCWGHCPRGENGTVDPCPGPPPPWADEVGIYHVIVSDPDDIEPYDHTKILDLSTNNEVSEISKAGEFIVFGDGTKFWMSKGNWTFGDLTDTSKVTNMDRLFYNCVKFNSDISNWDTSKVTNMNSMFGKAIEFNQDISGWNVSNVTNMAGMFGAQLQESDSWYVGMTIFNKDISNWNVSNVTNMSGMFRENSAFNQDISKWDMTKAEPWPNEEQGTDVRWMFQNATAFNKNLAGWDMSNQTNLYYLFDGASSFNQDIGNWDTSKVHNMDGMFKNAVEFNQDLSLWCVEDANRNDSPPSHYRFDMGATKFKGKNKPVWGTCPRGENA